jgi:hypothetical protein
MSEKEKRESVAGWDAFAERCAKPPVEAKPKKKDKKTK